MNFQPKMLCALVLSTGMIALTACSDSKDTIQNVTEDASLQGRFLSECGSSSLIDMSERTALMFQGNEFTRTQSYFTADDCQEEGAKIDYTGTFTIDADGLPETEGGALNIKVESMKILVNSEAVATALSAINFCGVSQYVVGEEVTIEGELSQGLCPLMNVPAERYGVYKVEDDRLYLDNDLNSMSDTDENRAKALNTDLVYIKD